MFKRENRLVSGVRFNSALFLSVPQFVVKEKKNNLLLNRFGIVVSKKIDKRAVIRNRVKRMLRTILADLNKNMNPGHDILFITKVPILSKTKEENYSVIKNTFEKAGFFEKSKD